MFKIYILQSTKTRRYYIGHTNNIEQRLQRHNQGRVKSTKYGAPWGVVYTEDFKNKILVARRELEIKGYKGSIKFKILLGL